MSESRFQQVQRVFGEAKALDEDARRDLLERACADDDELRGEVESLLQMHDAPEDGFLSDPPLAAAAGIVDRTLPERIGTYEVIDRLGEGGMGVVYLARQAGTQRTVAVKVIRPGLTTPALMRRFEHEAQVLGRLRHAGIAQVYEVGIDDGPGGNGLPFMVMERIEGVPLLDFARDTNLGVKARLELFVEICDAVQHAHQKGVIHRDLKPGNILVEAPSDRRGDEAATGGRPKVLDFGVARLVEVDGPDATMHTNLGQLVGTLTYMSPEQTIGDSSGLDTRSDVYALGVILFELLSGRLPYELDRAAIPESVRVIQEDEPTTLAAVDPRLAADLGTITAKALEKDRERRYQSASELAADIRRFMRDEPITAHPPSAMYQLAKFARRNRALVVGSAAVLVVLVAGSVTSTWLAVAARRAEAAEATQRQRAEARAADVRRLSTTFLFRIHDQIARLPGALDARRDLVETGLAYLDGLTPESDGDPVLQRQLAAAYIKLGDLLGGQATGSMGDPAGALAAYTSAVDLLATNRLSDSPLSRQTLALAYAKTGDVHMVLQEWESATSAYADGIEIAERLVESRPRSVRARRDLSVALERQADALRVCGRSDEARDLRARAWDIGLALVAAHPDDPSLKRDLTVSVFKQATRHRDEDRLDDALVDYERYLVLVGELAAAEPLDVRAQLDLAMGHERVGQTLDALGREREAEARYLEAIAIGERLAAADPRSFTAACELTARYCWLGELQARQGRAEEARQSYLGYLRVVERASGMDATIAPVQRDLGVALYKLGEWHATAGSDEDLSEGERAEHWNAARARFTRAYDVFIDMRDRGLLGAGDAEVPETMRAEIARCDEVLGELEAPGS